MSPQLKLNESPPIADIRKKLIRQFGPWTAHNIHLGDGIYTIDENAPGQVDILRRLMQVIADVSHRPLKELRVLDLACLEGLYGIELALQGAKVVGIEGREANIEKGRFVKQVLNLTSLELIQEDVRHISIEKYGQFDVILCAGILYHLDAPDVFDFVERIFEMSTDFAVFDTHVSIAAKQVQFYRNSKYSGRFVAEHGSNSSPDEKAKHLWSSLHNVKSFWFTKPSLLNFLAHTGFTSVYECHNPSTIHDLADRVTLLAIKGKQKTSLLCSPLLNSRIEEDWPEKSMRRMHLAQRISLRRFLKAVVRSMPASARGFLKRLLDISRS